MRALSVLLVGCNRADKKQLHAILKQACHAYTSRSCERAAWLGMETANKGSDLVLVRCRQGEDWSAAALADILPQTWKTPLFAFCDGFDPELVISLANAGFARVIPMDRVEVYLPGCLETLFEECARDARRIQSLAVAVEWGQRDTEARFSHIFATSPVGMCILAYQDGRVLDVNDSLMSLLESTQEDLASRNLLKENLAQDFPHFRDELERSLARGNTLTLKGRLLTRQRKSIHVSLTADVVDWGGEKGIFLLILDIRDRVQAEETIHRINDDLERRVLERTASYETVNRALQQEIGFRKAIEQTSERLMQIVWETPDIVAMCDLNGRLLFLNKTGRQILGLDDEAPVSEFSLYDFYSAEFRPYILGYVTDVVNKDGIWYGEAELRIRGEVIPISQFILAHKDPDGATQYYSTIARDISEPRRAAAELQRAYEREKELGLLRSNFFSMTSHQFRTPLSTILSSAELLEHYGRQWPEEKRNLHLKRIEDAVQRLNQMLDDILTIGSLDANPQNVAIGAVDLGELCERMVKDATLADQGRHPIETVLNLSGQYLNTNENILANVLDNLISNALKFSAAGDPIHLSCDFNGGQALICITDHGIGIPDDEDRLIFEPFHRGSNVVDTPGSGLGLMIVEKSIKLIQGEIEIDSRIGTGTRVTLKIPDLSDQLS